MKKLLMLVLFTVLAASLSIAGSITVNSPNGNESLETGSSFNIKWSAAGVKNNVKITLWRNNNLVGLIIKDIPPQKSIYNWKVGSFVGGSAPLGRGYKIKIREQGGAAFKTEDMSNNNFTLKQGPPMYRVQIPSNKIIANRMPRINRNIFIVSPVIGVAAPKKGEKIFPEAKFYLVKWKIAGLIKQGPVKIELILMNGAIPKYYYTLANSTPNTGNFMWNFKRANWTPGNYKMRITLINSKIMGESGIFKLIPFTTIW